MKMFVKFVLVVFFVGLAFCQTPLNTEDAAKIKAKMVADCKAKIKDLTDEEFDNIQNKRIASKTKAGDCYIACVLKGCEYMMSNNTIWEKNLRDRLDRTRDQAPPEEYPKKIQILQYCKEHEIKEVKDECEVAKTFINCVVQQKKERNVTTKLW